MSGGGRTGRLNGVERVRMVGGWETSVGTFGANVRAALAGIAAACAAVALFAILSGFALSDARVSQVVKTAFAKNELSYATRIREDFFTECALLSMLKLRQGSAFWSALETRFILRTDEHPCDTLHTLVLGTTEERASLPAAVSYVNYPFGSRHFEAFVLSALDYGSATAVYLALSYGSIVLLFAAMLWRSRGAATVLAPLPLALLGAFAMHRFGANLAHAPGFFLAFAALALFVAAARMFRDPGRRVGFASALGVLAAYFDILNGLIVTLLALTILLNHFFYVRANREQPRYLRQAAVPAVAIFFGFLAAYVVVTGGRLGLLWLNGVDVSRFTTNLAIRTGSDIGIPVTFREVLERLFAIRSQLTPGGASTANWAFLAGVAGWIFAGLSGLAAWRLRRRLTVLAIVDVLVLAAVSLGVFAWYRCFVAHSFLHAAFMARLLAIPLACGVAAALLALAEAKRDRLPIPMAAAPFCIALVVAALLLHSRWTVGTATAARFIEAAADVVSCGRLGLKPDGRPDGIVEVSFEKITPPLAYLGVKVRSDTLIQLGRRNPEAAYHTGAFLNVLGIASAPGAPLRNNPEGGFRFVYRTEPRIFAHFCRDGEEPQSRYELLVDGVTIPLSR